MMIFSLFFCILFCVVVRGTSSQQQCDDDLPPVRIGGRILDIVNGKHFDEILEETPDSMRPPGLLVFYDYSNKTCMDIYQNIGFESFVKKYYPFREQLMVGRYDTYSNEQRTWYEFTPEMNLTKRMGVTHCPELVFVPPHCKGDLEWCEKGAHYTDESTYIVGCDDYIDHCGADVVHRLNIEQASHNEMKEWTDKLLSVFRKPLLDTRFKSFNQQRDWLLKRDITTTDNQLRNLYFPLVIPNFTDIGFKVIKTPENFEFWLNDFYERHIGEPHIEEWDSSATQLNFHKTPTKMYNLDKEFEDKVTFGDVYIKPLLEEWAKIKPLVQTSFYGIRLYEDGAYLKDHIDRIDTHVVSATISLRKLDKYKDSRKPWPIQIVTSDGKHVRYNHPEGTTVLYESAFAIHGRPYPNRGGPHLGCFIHFKPVDDKEWNIKAKEARELKNRFTLWES